MYALSIVGFGYIYLKIFRKSFVFSVFAAVSKNILKGSRMCAASIDLTVVRL